MVLCAMVIDAHAGQLARRKAVSGITVLVHGLRRPYLVLRRCTAGRYSTKYSVIATRIITPRGNFEIITSSSTSSQ